MKKNVVLILVLAAFGTWTSAEISPEELTRAVERMTPDQAYDFMQQLEAQLWEPVPTGFFMRMSVDMVATYSALDTVEMSTVALSGGEMDVDKVSGMEVGIMWRTFDERLRLGLRLGGWAATDSNLVESGYSRVDIEGGNIGLTANCQMLRTDAWLIWAEITPGVGYVNLETIDTPSGKATTLRYFDRTYAQLDMLGGVSLRLNPVISVFLSGGYRLAESVNLEEGGSETGLEFDASGWMGRLGLGINF